MAATFFHDFTRDDGSPVTVEFEHGDSVMIVDVMPNTPEYEALCKEWNKEWDARRTSDRLTELNEQLAAVKAASKLTDTEDERICTWLAEHHVVDYSDDIVF